MRHELYLKSDDFVILSFAVLVPHKRINYVFDALCELNMKSEGDGIRCIIVGDGPHRNALEEYARNKGLKGAVQFVGFSDRIFDYIEMADLCVLPYGREPFGIAALEALALGKPTLGLRDGGGIVEVLAPVCDGRLIANDISDLVERICHLRRNPSESAALAEECRQRAASFDPHKIVKLYDHMYRTVLRREANPAPIADHSSS